MNATNFYLESAKKQFLYYKTVGEKAMEQLEPEQLFISINEDTNSIATIIKHLSGNMISRWTEFMTTDGEKKWRNRDTEFDPPLQDKDVIFDIWNKGWSCLFDALNELSNEQLSEIIYIRNEGHTVIEAINRQLAHYPYHVGQIVFYAKMLKKSEWVSLSIPKNKSISYNTNKFSKDKSLTNFIDEELKRFNK
jgi:hypothetical protein